MSTPPLQPPQPPQPDQPHGPPVVPAWPWRYRPLGIRVAAGAAGTVTLGALVFLWLQLPATVRSDVSLGQRIMVLLIFAGMGAFLYGLARSSVRADAEGLRIVNVYRVWRLEWAQVVQVRLHPGEPWAVLDVDDGTTVKAMAIQGSDGGRARRAADELRALVEEQSRTPRDD